MSKRKFDKDDKKIKKVCKEDKFTKEKSFVKTELKENNDEKLFGRKMEILKQNENLKNMDTENNLKDEVTENNSKNDNLENKKKIKITSSEEIENNSENNEIDDLSSEIKNPLKINKNIVKKKNNISKIFQNTNIEEDLHVITNHKGESIIVNEQEYFDACDFESSTEILGRETSDEDFVLLDNIRENINIYRENFENEKNEYVRSEINEEIQNLQESVRKRRKTESNESEINEEIQNSEESMSERSKSESDESEIEDLKIIIERKERNKLKFRKASEVFKDENLKSEKEEKIEKIYKKYFYSFQVLLRQKKYSLLLKNISKIYSEKMLPKCSYDICNLTPYDTKIMEFVSSKIRINASFIAGRNCEYIAASFPKNEYFNEFDKLINKCDLVICLCSVENEDYLQNFILEEENEFFSLEIKNQVKRLRFKKWEDFSTPNINDFNIFYKKYLEIKNEHKNPKILVHCKAGVGRTGTFILYDILKDIKKENILTRNIFLEEFCLLREQRNYLVYNEVQLKWLLKVFELE